MWKQLARIALAAAVAAVMTGCVESVYVIQVNKDGSGQIMERTFMSPQLTQMMDGMGGMMGGMMEGMGDTGAEAAAPAVPGFEGMIKEKITEQAKQFGDTVTHQETKFLTNDEGWKGYVARFAFTDINQVNFNTNEGGEEEEEAAPEGEMAMDMGGDMDMESPVFKFEFAQGSPNVLTIIPQTEEEDASAESTEGSPEDAMADAMAGGMMQAMAGMFKGMRVTMLLQTEGKILETNASFPHPEKDNVITLLDIKMDALISNPAGMKALESNDMAKLAELGVDGVKVENPGKSLEVKF